MLSPSSPALLSSQTSTSTSQLSLEEDTHQKISSLISAPPLAKSRYNRQLLIPSISIPGQTRISQSKVLIIGLGGLGSPASLYLAGAGVHTLGLLDHDIVELSNLHRQIAHRESSIGEDGSLTKIQSALRTCQDLNSSVNYVTHEIRLNGENALEVIREYDLVLDCTDNPATRYLISDCCVLLGKTLISGAAQKLEGQLTVLNYPIFPESKGVQGTDIATGAATTKTGPQPVNSEASIDSMKRDADTVERGPCYRCVFPIPPSPELTKSCSEIGILGPVVGAIGTMMASETLRLICKPHESSKPTMLLYNAWSSDPRSMFRVIGLRPRRKDCVACGEEEAVRSKGKQKIDQDSIKNGGTDYEAFCGRIQDVNLLDHNQRINANEFLQEIEKTKTSTDEQTTPLIIDVREELEVELGPKLTNSINIPISRITRSIFLTSKANGSARRKDELDDILDTSGARPLYFVCQRGNDSQIAAKKTIDRLRDRLGDGEAAGRISKKWIGDVKGGFIAMEKLT